LKAGRLKYFLAAVLSVVIWGFFSIPLRKIQHYPSDEILYYRIFTSLILSWVFILLFRIKQVKSDLDYFYSLNQKERRKIIILSLLSGLLISGNWFTYIYAVNNVNLKSAAFAYMVCPMITALAGFLILKEHFGRFKIIALGIASLSIIILAQGSMRDVLWSVFIAVLYTFFLIVQKVLNKVDKFNMLGLQLLIASIFMFPFYVFSFNSFPLDTYFWIDILVIAIFFTIIPLFLSLYALIGMPSSTLGIIIYLNPIVAFAVAFFYFHEEISLYQVYAYLLLFIAIIVFNWNTIKEMLFKVPANDLSEITP
jgi:chloramphenicol-sensitive protein RarD